MIVILFVCLFLILLLLFIILLFVPLPPTFTAPKDSAVSGSFEYRYYYLTPYKKRVGAFSKGCKVPVNSKVRVFPFVWGHVQVQKKDQKGDWINSQVSLNKKHQFTALEKASLLQWQKSPASVFPWTIGTKYIYSDADGNVSDPSDWVKSSFSSDPVIQLGKNAVKVWRQVETQTDKVWKLLQNITIDSNNSWTFVDTDNPATSNPDPEKPSVAPSVQFTTPADVPTTLPWTTPTQYAIQFFDAVTSTAGPLSDFTSAVSSKTQTFPIIKWNGDSRYKVLLWRKVGDGEPHLATSGFNPGPGSYTDKNNPISRLPAPVVDEWNLPIYCPCDNTKGWSCDTSTGLCVKRSQNP